jgi:hypothetical protein
LPGPGEIDSLVWRSRYVAWEDGLDQFITCWEGLEDPLTGNAGLHDFHGLLVIALCTVLCGGQGVNRSGFAGGSEP